MREKEPLLICPICGKEYKAKKYRNKRQVVCSRKCGYSLLYPKGTLEYISKQNGMTEKQFMDLIDKEHNQNNLTIWKKMTETDPFQCIYNLCNTPSQNRTGDEIRISQSQGNFKMRNELVAFVSCEF